MAKEVKRRQARYRGKFGVYVSDPTRGYRWGYQEKRPFYLASGVKAAFMVEVFRQRESGDLSFDETIELTEERLRDGAPRVNKEELGTKLSITTLLDWMMRSSDNAASDMLASRVGRRNVNRGLLEEGIKGFTRLTYLIDVRRGIYRELDVRADDFTPLDVRTIRWTQIWQPQVNKINELLGVPPYTYSKDDLMEAYDRYYATGVNRAPMASVGLLFEKMVFGTLINLKCSKEMLELMSAARTSTHRLLGRLPHGTRVAHKTGSQFQHICDLGVIFLPDDSPLIVTICTEGGDVHPSEDVVARLARKAYDLTVADHQRTASKSP